MATRSRTARPKKKQKRPAQPRIGDAGREFQRLVDIMAWLRGPGGCPWDREQTLESLRGFVLEETYEVLDAIDRGDHDALRGEIGDLLFEGVFLAQVEADEGRFSVADSLRLICDKLIRRHPHIFGSGSSQVRTPGQVVEQWEQIKAREQKDAGERRSLLRGVPPTLPSLLRAHEIGTRVAAVGFDWSKTGDVVDKIEEEVRELRQALNEGSARSEEEMGDLLFSIANLARKLGIEPESALRRANEKFSARFEAVERAFEAQGRSIHDATLDEMESQWQMVKSASPTVTVELHAPTAAANTATAAVPLHPPAAASKTATATVELHAPMAAAKIRRSEDPKEKTAPITKPSTRAGRAPAGGRRQK